eukprot:102055-Ditylum_brightwellii.AAC.1
MVLHIHSDASFMSETEARSRAGGHFFLDEKSTDPTKPPTHQVPLNGPVHTVCEVIRNVMASTAEAEIGAFYSNTHKGEELRLALVKMGLPQPPTPVLTDNSTACCIINTTVKQRRTHAIDMCFYLVRDRCAQGHFLVYRGPGKDNLGDYHTKHHSAAHHKRVHPMFLHSPHGVLLSVFTDA